MGLLGSDKPARERRIALETALIASLCPMTRWCRAASSLIIFRSTFCPVYASILKQFQQSLLHWLSPDHLCVGVVGSVVAACNCLSNSGIWPYCNSNIRAKSPARRAVSISCLTLSKRTNMLCTLCCCFFSFQISSKSEDYFFRTMQASSNIANRFSCLIFFFL